MSQVFDFKLQGDKELKNLLTELPKRVARKANRSAVTAGANPIKAAYKAALPRRSGMLAKAASKKIKTYPNYNAAAIIGANKATMGDYQGRRVVPANYAHLVEAGARPHGYKTRQGQHPGMKGTHPLEQAFEQHKAEALEIAKQKFTEVVEAEARKLASK